MSSLTYLVNSDDYTITFDRTEKVACIRILNGYANRESFDSLKEATMAMYGETRDKQEKIVLEFDITMVGGVHPSYVYEFGELFRRLRPMSEEILERTVIRLQVGMVSRVIRAFLALYPLTRPIQVVEYGEGGEMVSVGDKAPS